MWSIDCVRSDQLAICEKCLEDLEEGDTYNTLTAKEPTGVKQHALWLYYKIIVMTKMVRDRSSAASRQSIRVRCFDFICQMCTTEEEKDGSKLSNGA